MTRTTQDEFTYFEIIPKNDPNNLMTFKIETIVVEGIEDAFPSVTVEETLQFVVDEESEAFPI